MRVLILGRFWELRFVKNLANRGDCDPPQTKGKMIRIKSSLNGEEELEVILHELIHAAEWKLRAEEHVEEEARDFARILWRLGYRRVNK